MYQWRPSQWVKWAPLTILPFVAGAWLQTGGLVDDVVSRAQALVGDSNKIAVDGRDVTVSGQVASEDAKVDLFKALHHIYGVRTVDMANVKVVAPVALMAPTVESITANSGMPEIKGTWPSQVATTLSVGLNGKTYELNKDAELTAVADSWSLKPTTAIPDGAYDVTATVSDGASQTVAAAAPGKIVIDTVVKAPEPAPAPAVEPQKVEVVPLAMPTAMAAVTNSPAPSFMGTYPKEAAKLSVDLDNKTYQLGTDKELTVDDAGHWTLKPGPLADGEHSIISSVADAAGSAPVHSEAQKIVVDTVAPSAPVVSPAVAGAVWPYAITGTWPEVGSAGMSISLAGQAYAVGKDKELISDGKGNFTFMPSTVLAPGHYNLDMTVVDNADNITNTVVRDAIVVEAPPPPLVPLNRPTVESSKSDTDKPMIMGTWPAKAAKNLSVAVDGTTYSLGTDAELTSDADGKWMLMSKNSLANGTYNVVAFVSDDNGQRARDATQGELVVAVAAPAAEPVPAPVAAVAALPVPTVEASTSDSDHPTVKGTWPAGKANSLTVSLDGTSYKLGHDFDLLSNAAGNWTLKPKKPLVNGTYDVIAQVADANGQSAMDATQGELVVNVAPPPPPPPAEQPYDCVATLARISAVFPVRFEFNVDSLANPYDLSVNQYAALLKDARCMSVKVQVAGHADYKGSEAYNQGLSERRAQHVIDMLVKAGITADRLNGVGYSKDKPLDPALDDSARMKNRRVEFTVAN
jgi:large repetitive protein